MGAAVVGAAVVGAVVGEAVVGATVEGGHGLYSPNGAKTGRLQSGLNSPKNLSCPVWSTGPESRGEVRQRRRITSFISSVTIGNWNCEAKILRRFIFTLLQIESFVDVVIMSYNVTAFLKMLKSQLKLTSTQPKFYRSIS